MTTIVRTLLTRVTGIITPIITDQVLPKLKKGVVHVIYCSVEDLVRPEAGFVLVHDDGGILEEGTALSVVTVTESTGI